MSVRKLCCECARKDHGKPVRKIPRIYSKITHMKGADRNNGIESLLSRYEEEAVKQPIYKDI